MIINIFKFCWFFTFSLVIFFKYLSEFQNWNILLTRGVANLRGSWQKAKKDIQILKDTTSNGGGGLLRSRERFLLWTLMLHTLFIAVSDSDLKFAKFDRSLRKRPKVSKDRQFKYYILLSFNHLSVINSFPEKGENDPIYSVLVPAVHSTFINTRQSDNKIGKLLKKKKVCAIIFICPVLSVLFCFGIIIVKITKPLLQISMI